MINRRQFLSATALSVPVAFVAGGCGGPQKGLVLEQTGTLGGLKQGSGAVPIEGAVWYEAGAVDDGIEYRIPAGSLAKAKFLTCDMLLDGNHLIVYHVILQEGEDGPKCGLRFSGLNQCSFRVRFPLTLLDLNHWGIEREGAFLKPRVGGERVDPAKVDRIRFIVARKSSEVARWCMTDLVLTDSEVKKLTAPVLPKGPLLDEMGQSTIHHWPAKTKSVDEMVSRIQSQFNEAPKQKWPAAFSRWGGWKAKRLTKGAGYFRTFKEGDRWWLVDPDGYAFWSAGVDCVRVDTTARFDGIEKALTWIPEKSSKFGEALRISPDEKGGKYITYLATNMIRTFGSDGWHEKWAAIALGELRRLRFNTVGNWSEWNWAKQSKFPYVRPMNFSPKRVSLVYRTFPDVYDPEFAKDAADFASILEQTAADPAFIGYFLMNEPTWGFSSEVPAAGMLFTTTECATRKALAEFLKKKYSDDATLAGAWKIDTTFANLAGGKWTERLTDEANSDLCEFSSQMTERYFRMLSEACRKVDPNHLNLGMRWAGVPPEWAVEGMKSFDVFSLNMYKDKLPRDVTDKIHSMLKMPILVGEWHFGALDVGLPASGIGHLKNQTDRGKAYRVYIEDAAANPNCVGTHWFTLYDESALGRFDGENYNIGFLDVCNRPYDELSAAGKASHEQIYQVAAGEVKPYNDVPEYLPKLF